MKKLINLKGVRKLNATHQKEINGAGFPGCSGNCYGRPQGSRCYYHGHCGCPGVCMNNGCLPL